MMKSNTLLLLVLGMLITTSLARQHPRNYKLTSESQSKFLSLQEKINLLKMEEEELENEIGDELHIDGNNNYDDFIREFEPQVDESVIIDPCKDLFCGPGRECLLDDFGKGSCHCVQECNDAIDERRKVCSNQNDTWSSDCELYKMRCYCTEDNNKKCINKRFEHIHIDYYGSCQTAQHCSSGDMSDFPRRMREWLFNIMRDMVDRETLSDYYRNIQEISEKDQAKKWINAAVWKWCELDEHPKDKSVSRHELFPLRAPLYTLEHCIAPFLDSCDPNDDHRITLKEWAGCLKFSEEEIQNMEDFCEDIKN